MVGVDRQTAEIEAAIPFGPQQPGLIGVRRQPALARVEMGLHIRLGDE